MIKNITALLISCVLSLLILEQAARVFCPIEPRVRPLQAAWVEVPEKKWVEYHPILGWFHEKGKTAVLETPEVRAQIHTNSRGLRGSREYLRHKALHQAEPRIAAIGDSFTFGFGVNDAEVFTSKLEAARPGLEVLNFGVAGYGLDQTLLLYRQIAAAYQPDVVLIDIFHEMFWRCTRRFTASGYSKPYFKLSKDDRLLLKNVPVPQPYAFHSGQFPELFESGPVERLLMKSVLYWRLREIFMRWGRKLGIIDPDMSDDWILGRRILTQLAGEIKKIGAVPVIVVVPPQDWVRSPEKNQMRRSLLRFAKREQLPILDLSNAFYNAGKKSSVEDYYIPGDWHWSARGHALAAHEIEKFLTDNQWLSTSKPLGDRP